MDMESKEKKPVGRPSVFSQDIANRICEELAIGYSLRSVCKADDMPSIATVFNWFRTNKEFLEQYARAKQESADAMAEDILDIADESTNDWKTLEYADGREYDVVNNEAVQRSRLRVDTRKWLMAKMKPKKYGEKLDVVSDGEKIQGNSIVFVDFTKDETDSK